MWFFSKENSFFYNLSFFPPFKKLPTFCLTFMLFFVFWIGRSVFKMTLSFCVSIRFCLSYLSLFLCLSLSLSHYLCLSFRVFVYPCISVSFCPSLCLLNLWLSLFLFVSIFCIFVYLSRSVFLSLSHTRLFCLCLSEIMLMFYFPCFYLSVHDYRGEKIPLATTLSIATRAFGEMK